MSLRARLLVAFLSPTLVLLAAGGFLLFRASRNVLEDQLGSSLTSLAAALSSQVRADRVLALTAEDSQGEGTRTYRSLFTQIRDFRDRAGLRRVLIFDKDHRARLDVGGEVPLLQEAPELLRDSLELERVFSGEAAASQVLFLGRDGTPYKTGYAPLFQDGQVVGAVAVEGSAQFFGPLQGLRNAFVALAALTLVMLAIAAALSAQALKAPLDRLVGSAVKIASGDLATKVNGEGRWEIGVLADQLEAMRLSLESRDRQLKLMLGGVAHEVKNPLGGLELFAGLLGEELSASAPDLPEARSHLQKIRRELDYLGRIVEDFLAFAREQKLNPAPFEARALVEGALSHLAGEASGRGVTLTHDVDPCTLSGDEHLLTSALVNLVKNAVQVSGPDKPVRVVGRRGAASYHLEVCDQGPGIPTDRQAQVFEPFFTTREKGTGLGLPLARKLVEAHRGTLSVRSTPGSTVFELTLPLPDVQS